MVRYNDDIWMNYVKKYEDRYPIELLSKHDGFIIPCTNGFLIPYSIDNEELLFVSKEDGWMPKQMGWLKRFLSPYGRLQQDCTDSFTFIIPEKYLHKLEERLGINTK